MKKSKFLFSLALLAATMGFNFKAGALGRQIVGPNSMKLIKAYLDCTGRSSSVSRSRAGVEHFHLPNGRTISHIEASRRCVKSYYKFNPGDRANAINGSNFLYNYMINALGYGKKNIDLRDAVEFVKEISKRVGLTPCREVYRNRMAMGLYIYENLSVFKEFLSENVGEMREIFMKIISATEEKRAHKPKPLPHIYEMTDDSEFAKTFEDPKYFLPESIFDDVD